MVSVSASRFAKFLEAFSQFSEEVLLEPEDEWLGVRAIDKTHVIAAFGKLKLEEPLYDKFGLNLRHALRFLKRIHSEVQLRLEDGKLLVEGTGFSLKLDTIDPASFKLYSEPNLKFDLDADVEIALLADVLKKLRRVDAIEFIADRDSGLRLEAATETSRFSQWLGTPTLYGQVQEVRVKFNAHYLSQIIKALEILSRPPNATFTRIELKSNYPGRFTLTDSDLVFRSYIAPRVD
jgi:hypothetical protein